MHTSRPSQSASSLPPELLDGISVVRKDAAAPRRVLVVDDETVIADTIVQILNRSGFQAQAVYNGKDAIEAARRLKPDTILSDVLMPHLDGVETAIAIRADLPAVRIVLISGQSSTVEILERARVRGYEFELLPKPIHPTELLRHLRG